jgi:hypothetical protein
MTATSRRSVRPTTEHEPSRVPAVASVLSLASVVVLLVALPLLTSVIFYPGLVVEKAPRENPLLLPLFVGVSAPWVVALLLLPWRRLRLLGLVFAASLSIVTLLPLVPWMAFWTLVSGHMLGNKDQWASYFAAMATTLVLMVLAGLASLAAYRLRARHKSIWPWLVGPAGAISYVLVFVVFANASGDREVRRKSEDAHREDRARRRLEAIAKCAKTFATQHPDRGLPTSLKEMAATGCLAAVVASGEDEGFRYFYFPGVPVASGHVRTYTACATPVRSGHTGWRTTVVDETGVIPTPLYAAPESPGVTCRDAWSEDEQAIKYCALRYATAHPDRGYPATLREIGPEGDGCLKQAYYRSTYREHSATTDNYRFTYLAGARDRSGRIASYEIHRHGTWVDSRMHAAVNEAGERRFIFAARLTTPRDPLESTLKAQSARYRDSSTVERQCDADDAESCFEVAQRLRDSRNPSSEPRVRMHALYERACAGGFGDACRALARFSLTGTPPEMTAMRDAYRRGCLLADGESCLELARLLSEPVGGPVMLTDETRPLLERACVNRAGTACLRLAQDAESRLAPGEDVEGYLTSGCDAGDPASCITLGERLLPAEPDRATRLLITGCAGSNDRDRCARYW